MWVWKKSVAKAKEDEWQQRVGGIPGAVFSEGFHAERLNIDIYTENAEEALVLQACYGGSVEELKSRSFQSVSPSIRLGQ